VSPSSNLLEINCFLLFVHLLSQHLRNVTSAQVFFIFPHARAIAVGNKGDATKLSPQEGRDTLLNRNTLKLIWRIVLSSGLFVGRNLRLVSQTCKVQSMQLATSRHQSKRRERAENSAKKKSSAWKELFQGLSLYAFCIAVPGMIRMIIFFYNKHVVSFANSHMRYLPPWLRGEDEEVGIYDSRPNGEYDLGDKEGIMSFFSVEGIGQCHDSAANYVCGLSILSSENARRCQSFSSWFRSVASYISGKSTMEEHLTVLDDVTSDVQYLIALSVVLAIIRVLLVYMLVPRYLAPRRLAAFMRCKSTHLLSSAAYQFSPLTEKPLNQKAKSLGNGNVTGVGIIAGGDAVEGQGHFVLNGNLDGPVRRGGVSSALRRLLDSTYNAWCNFRSAFRRATGHESTAPYESLDATAALRLFSAPKYATAIFRLIYCTLSCTGALILFRSADFWPIYVGGKPTSSTKNCWDLSGTIAIGSLDSDFDHMNVALRFFFLAQASYQVHSLFFHIVSMILLLTYGRKKDGAIVSMKSSMRSYLRPLVEHFITLCLIFGAYIFSGLRRLGAVVMFTLEFSSIFLQILQICINSPDNSILRRPRVISVVHRYVVLPIFIYCRFLVFPKFWYSAAFESEEWLDQIEKAFMPGSALVLYIFFNGLIMLIFGLNLVFFRRLLFHPLLNEMASQKMNVSRSRSFCQ